MGISFKKNGLVPPMTVRLKSLMLISAGAAVPLGAVSAQVAPAPVGPPVAQPGVQVPANPNLAPPGWYLLTIVDHQRRPSCARWIQLTPE